MADTKSSNDMLGHRQPDGQEDFVCRGGSCIISPFGDILAGPIWETENDELLAEC